MLRIDELIVILWILPVAFNIILPLLILVVRTIWQLAFKPLLPVRSGKEAQQQSPPLKLALLGQS